MKLLLLAALLAVPLFASCKVEDVATPQELTIIETMESQRTQLQAALDAGDLTVEAVAEITEQVTALDAAIAAAEEAIAKRATRGWLDWLPLPGPIAPFKELLVGLTPLLFPRVRQNLKKGAKAAAKGDMRTALLTPFRTIGLAHSSGDPLKVMKGAAAAARARGDVSTAVAIENAIASMPPPAATTA